MSVVSEDRVRAKGTYSLEGSLLEVCSCGAPCPCFIGEDPDGGRCFGLVAFHFDQGHVEGIDVSGLTIANIAEIPGNALDGAWRVVVVVDGKGSEEQRAALLKAFNGDLGGPLADLAGLIGDVVAVETVPISHAVDGIQGSFAIEGMLEAEVESIKGASGDPTTLRDTMFSTVPGAPAYVGKAARFEVDLPQHDMVWSYEGQNAIQTAWKMEHAG